MLESRRCNHDEGKEYVCGECLKDDALSDLVADCAESTKCDFCEKQLDEPHAATLDNIIEHMKECISEEYTDPANELPYETREGGYRGEKFDAWELLMHVEFSVDSEDLFERVVGAFSDQDWCRRDYYCLTPSERLSSGWEAFKKAVKHVRRFTFWSMPDESGESEYHPDYMPVGELLVTVAERIRDAKLVKSIPADTCIWRVRVHKAGTELSASHEMGPPSVDLSRQSNRMSPAGIVMFYGAEDFDTACVETLDPTQVSGKRVTGVEFRTVKEIQLLDLFDLPRMPSFFRRGSSDFRQTLVFLRDFARDLANPVVRDGREHIDYVPTQAFAEYLRYEFRCDVGTVVDGIRYRSALNGRPCFVLFCGAEHCGVGLRAGSTCEQWLEFNKTSLRIEDAEDVARELKRNGEQRGRP